MRGRGLESNNCFKLLPITEAHHQNLTPKDAKK